MRTISDTSANGNFEYSIVSKFYDQDQSTSTDITLTAGGINGLYFEWASTESGSANIEGNPHNSVEASTSTYIGISIGKIAGIVALACYFPYLIPAVSYAFQGAY